MYGIDLNNINHIHGFVKNKNDELVIGHCNREAILYTIKKKKEAEINCVNFCSFNL